jgi:hypothetical protein
LIATARPSSSPTLAISATSPDGRTRKTVADCGRARTGRHGSDAFGRDKTNEPGSLKRHLAELLDAYPALQLLTGDAIYAQRPLLETLQQHGCDYLFQVKANQPDLLDTLETCFFQETPVRPAHEVTEERGSIKKRGNFGSISTTPNMSESI